MPSAKIGHDPAIIGTPLIILGVRKQKDIPRDSGPPCFTNQKSKIQDSTFLLHLSLSDAAGAGLATTLAGSLQLQLTGAGCAVEAVVQLLTERTPRQIAVNLAFTFTMAAHHNPGGNMGEVDAIIRLVDFLAAFAAAVRTISTCAVFYKCS